MTQSFGQSLLCLHNNYNLCSSLDREAEKTSHLNSSSLVPVYLGQCFWKAALVFQSAQKI